MLTGRSQTAFAGRKTPSPYPYRRENNAEVCFDIKHTRRSFFLVVEGKSAAFSINSNHPGVNHPGAARHPSTEGNGRTGEGGRPKFPSVEGCPAGAGWYPRTTPPAAAGAPSGKGPRSVLPLRGLHIAPKLLNPKANDGYGEQAERARRDGWQSVRSMARNGTRSETRVPSRRWRNGRSP
jgi:hypothetical protein